MSDELDIQIRELGTKVQYRTVDFSIEHLLEKTLNDELDITRDDLANPSLPYADQSRLVEDLILGFPMLRPIILSGEFGEETPARVIGSRPELISLISFTWGNLRLTRMRWLTEAEGLSFFDLSPLRQRRYLRSLVRTVVFEDVPSIYLEQLII